MYVCYVLMRHLPKTMNPGKAMAQVHHAWYVLAHNVDVPDAKEYAGNIGFGTTIVLEAINKINTEKQIKSLVNKADKDDGLFSGVVIDPTYPVDHEVTMKLLTCGYIFGKKEDIDAHLPEIREQWKLHT